MRLAEIMSSDSLPCIGESVATGLTFHDEVHGYQHGQTDQRLTAYQGARYVGHIDYAVSAGEPHVQMISVPTERRQGYATALVLHLQSLFPDQQIHMGMVTDAGAKLLHSIPQTTVVNPEYATLAARLAKLRAREAELQHTADAYDASSSRDEAQRWFLAVADEWNDLNDEIRRLETELADQPQAKRLFVAETAGADNADIDTEDDGPRHIRDLSRHFRELNNFEAEHPDDIDEFDLTSPDAAHHAYVQHNFLFGECAPFALALHRLTGWPIFAMRSGDRYHVFVRHPSGRFVDASGFVSPEQIRQTHRMRKTARARPVDPAVLAADLDDAADPWGAVRVAEFYIHQLQVPPFDTLTRAPPE